MIVYDRQRWLAMVVRLHGSVLPMVWRRILTTTVVAAVMTYVQRRGWIHVTLTATPFIITGLPLGIILGFRNSSSYDRFWEGRKLLGALVNASRSFTRQLRTYVRAVRPEDEPAVESLRRRATYRLIAFAYALRMHLRRESDRSALEPLLGADEVSALAHEPSPPAAVLHRMGDDVREALANRWIRARHASILEGTLVLLTEVVGGCERIKNTPTPLSYLIFIHRAVALYCLLLPFGVLEAVHSYTPLVVFFVSYALFSLDAIGDELDDPFRASKNTLPLGAIARTIDIDARRRLGEEHLPPPILPDRGVLS